MGFLFSKQKVELVTTSQRELNEASPGRTLICCNFLYPMRLALTALKYLPKKILLAQGNIFIELLSFSHLQSPLLDHEEVLYPPLLRRHSVIHGP